MVSDIFLVIIFSYLYFYIFFREGKFSIFHFYFAKNS